MVTTLNQIKPVKPQFDNRNHWCVALHDGEPIEVAIMG
jgi:hypothetical protein